MEHQTDMVERETRRLKAVTNSFDAKGETQVLEEARGEYKKANDECNKKKDDIEKKLKAAKVSEFLNSLSKRNDKNKSASKNDKANIVDTTADDELQWRQSLRRRRENVMSAKLELTS
ncbi:hypothetical protein AGMMS49921_13920 [Endomicrobiia bacterium]|nr:hypothetical protein AGMMS49921_13920 [Endomicrobiia bacterium]